VTEKYDVIPVKAGIQRLGKGEEFEMRRFCVLALPIFGVLTIIVGIAEAQTWYAGPAVARFFVASMFVAICLIHIVINRKAVARYLRGK
jgi:uncharacterized ion transporter superfamily protein YfcC